MIIPMFVFSNQALAWGPEAHTAMGQTILDSEECRQDIIDNSDSFLLGNILPDIPLSLAYYKKQEDAIWMDRQYLFHSDKFLNAMIELSTTSEERAFVYGWLAHITSDKIESAYSKRQMAKGAPVGAEFPVDTLVRASQRVNINSSIRNLIQQSIDNSGGSWHVSNAEWVDIQTAYNGYFSLFYQIKLKQNYGAIAEEWYSDYASELAKSVVASLEAMAEPPEPSPPSPDPPSIVDYYRGLGDDSNMVELSDVVQAANDYLNGVIPPGFTAPITLSQLVELANEWIIY